MTGPAVPSGLEALLAKATPGPWAHYDGPDDNWDEIVLNHFTPTGPYGFSATHDDPQAVNDARLIALAPDAVRLLIDMRELLRHVPLPFAGEHDTRRSELLARFAALEQRAGAEGGTT